MLGTVFTLVVRYRNGTVRTLSTQCVNRRDEWLETLQGCTGRFELIAERGGIITAPDEILAYEVREE